MIVIIGLISIPYNRKLWLESVYRESKGLSKENMDQSRDQILDTLASRVSFKGIFKLHDKV